MKGPLDYRDGPPANCSFQLSLYLHETTNGIIYWSVISDASRNYLGCMHLKSVTPQLCSSSYNYGQNEYARYVYLTFLFFNILALKTISVRKQHPTILLKSPPTHYQFLVQFQLIRAIWYDKLSVVLQASVQFGRIIPTEGNFLDFRIS